MIEMSLVELESELAAELPTREMMSRRHGRRGASAHAHANNGSVANGNATNQSINNSQTAALLGVNSGRALGQANAALVAQIGADRNTNTNTQFGTPVNFSN